MVCPIGGELHYIGKTKNHGKADLVQRYRCENSCFCPFAAICSKDKKGRVVEKAIHREKVLKQWKKQRSKPEEHRDHMKKRASTVECVFGHVKRNLETRYLDWRGKESVETVWATALCATNLRRILPKWNPI